MKKIMLWMFVFIVLSSFAFAELNDSEVYYSFDNDNITAGGNAIDLSGNNFLGTNNNAYTGRVGIINQSFGFNLTDTVSNNSMNGGNIDSISFWVNPDTDGSEEFYFCLGDGADNDRLCFSKESNNKVRFQLKLNTASQFVIDSSSTLSAASGWYHVVGIMGTGGAKLYINNVEVGSDASTSLPDADFDEMVLGKASWKATYFDGQLDEFGAWNKRFSTDEISDLYNSGAGYNPYALVVAPIDVMIYDVTPIDLYNSSTNIINFNATLNHSLDVNCSLYINNTLNITYSYTGDVNLSRNLNAGWMSTTNLLSYWKFDGDSTEEISGYHGTDISFEGTEHQVTGGWINGYVDMSPNEADWINITGTDNTFHNALNTSYSLSFWIIQGATGGVRPIAGKGNGIGAGTTDYHKYLWNANKFTTTYDPNGGADWNCNSDVVAIEDGTWHHAIYSKNSTHCWWVVDGVKGTVTAVTTPDVYNNYEFMMGATPINPNPSLMKLDDFGIYSQVLTDAEAEEIYNIQKNGYTLSTTSENITFPTTFPSTDTSYNYNIFCTDGSSTDNTTLRTFNVDVVAPVVDSLLDPTTNYFTLFGNYTFNATDTFLKNFSYTDDCGRYYLNSTPGQVFSYANKTNISTCGIGTKNVTIQACDNFRCTSANYIYEARGRIRVFVENILGGTINTYDTYLNDTLKGSATNGYFNLDNLTNSSFNVSVDNTGYELASSVTSMTDVFVELTFSLYTTNSINFTFLEEKFKTLITDANISVEFVGDYTTYNYSTLNGSLYADLIFPSEYVIRYKANASYGDERRYHFTMTNRTHNELTLYLLKNTYASDLIVTVYDQISLSTIEGAVVYLQRYDLGSNSYNTVAMYQSDVSGKAFFEVEQNVEYYKFLVDFPSGTRRLTSNPLYIQSSTLNLYLNLLQTVGQTYYEQESITYSFSYNNNTRQFTADYTDSELVSDEFCLYIKEDGRYSKTILNSTCSTSSSGSLVLGHPNEDGIYYAVLTGNLDGEEVVIGVAWRELDNDKLGAGTFGIFMTIILIIILTFISRVSKFALLFGTSGLIFAKMLGLLTIGWPFILMAVMLSIVIMIILEVVQ